MPAMTAKKEQDAKKEDGHSPLEALKELYHFMVEQKLETAEYDHQGLHVRLVRQRLAPVPVSVPVMSGAGGAAHAAHAGAPAAPALAAGALTVKAPMMGIFYRAGSPSSPPFAKQGDVVKRGQVLCLIEAMKVFNEIKADFDCSVDDVLVENGKPVKPGQDIFVITKK